MKPLKSLLSKKEIVIVLGAMFFILASMNAQSQQTELAANENNNIHIRYVEGDNDVLCFNLKYNNESGSDFKLMVLNESGDIMFQQKYSGKKIRKNLRLPRLTDTDNVTFLIKPSSKNVQLSYKVKITDKVVDTPVADTQVAL